MRLHMCHDMIKKVTNNITYANYVCYYCIYHWGWWLNATWHRNKYILQKMGIKMFIITQWIEAIWLGRTLEIIILCAFTIHPIGLCGIFLCTNCCHISHITKQTHFKKIVQSWRIYISDRHFFSFFEYPSQVLGHVLWCRIRLLSNNQMHLM